MLKRTYSKDRTFCNVTFVIEPEQARDVKTAVVVGDFNQWSKTANPMKKTPDGYFEAKIKLECGKEYHFRYFFNDDRWDNDWHADKYQRSPLYDLENSVVIV